MKNKTVLGAILAGGKSKRMRKDKALLEYGNGTLLSNSISILSQVVPELAIIVDDENKYTDTGEQVWQDFKPDCGPIAGIYTAFRLSDCGYVLSIACDMPFLEPSFLRHLLSFRNKFDVVIPRTTKGYEPLCAVWSIVIWRYLK
jgi:molybdopterin-guanine dinucleotide biosynthesis protein A